LKSGGGAAQFQSVRKYKGLEIEAVTYCVCRFMRKSGLIIWLCQYQEITDHHSDGIYIDEVLLFFGRDLQ
jgi:hypothetical protein